MKMGTLLEIGFYATIIALIVAGSVGFIKKTLSTYNWMITTGTYLESEIHKEVIEGEYGPTHTGNYVVSITYEYRDPVDKATKRSSSLLAGGTIFHYRPPVALARNLAEDLVTEFKQKGTFPVYINPDDTSDIGIVRIRDFYSRYGKIELIISGIATIALLILGMSAAVYIAYLINFKPEVIQGFVDKLSNFLQR